MHSQVCTWIMCPHKSTLSWHGYVGYFYPYTKFFWHEREILVLVAQQIVNKFLQFQLWTITRTIHFIAQIDSLANTFAMHSRGPWSNSPFHHAQNFLGNLSTCYCPPFWTTKLPYNSQETRNNTINNLSHHYTLQSYHGEVGRMANPRKC